MANTDSTDLAERPAAPLNCDLAVGQLGYWPMLGAVPADIAVGDRVSFRGDAEGDIVAEVHGGDLRIGYTTREGKKYNVGRRAHGFRLDRWGTHAELSRKGTR